MRVLRVVTLVFGILALLLGSWWILQGTGVVPVGFMANHMEWAWRGIGVAVVGLVVIYISRRM